MKRVALVMSLALVTGCGELYDGRRQAMYYRCVDRAQTPDTCVRAVNNLFPPRRVKG